MSIDDMFINNGMLNVRIQGIDKLAGANFNMDNAYGHLVSLSTQSNCLQLLLNPFETTPYLYVRCRWSNTNDWFTFRVQLTQVQL